MRRTLLATVAALTLLTAQPARSDIGPGDLDDALDEFGGSWIEELIDSICQYLLELAELPEMALPTPLPPPAADHVEGEPVTIEEADEYASQRVEDRTARVEALDNAARLAASASQSAGMTIQTLSAANVSPVSVVAGIQLNTAMAAAAAGDQMAATQLLAAQVGMQADQALQQERERAIAQAQSKAIFGEVRGGRIEVGTFKPRW